MKKLTNPTAEDIAALVREHYPLVTLNVVETATRRVRDRLDVKTQQHTIELRETHEQDGVSSTA